MSAVLRLLARREVSVAEHVAVAMRLLALGHSRLPTAVLDRAERKAGPHPDVTRLRRSAPRYVGKVSAHHLGVAASRVVGRRVRPRDVVTEPIRGGRSWRTVTVVRHVVRPEGVSFVRKSLQRPPPREARLYQSGLVATPGRLWRAPTVFAVNHTPVHSHLFLEDLGQIRRPRTQAEFLDAARALAEFAVQFRGQESIGSWLEPTAPPRLSSYDAAGGCLRLVSSNVADRLRDSYAELRHREPVLRARLPSRPTTLCHGDAHAGNVAMDPNKPRAIVLFDWGFVHVGAIGVDLGNLLSLPFMSADRSSLDPDACLAAYLDVIGSGSPEARHAEQAYRHQFAYRSLRWWASRSRGSRWAFRESDAVRICDAASLLCADA